MVRRHFPVGVVYVPSKVLDGALVVGEAPTVEYRVEHPRWNVWRADNATLECDVASLYGAEFRDALAGAPSTAFVAEGSPVLVRRGRRVA